MKIAILTDIHAASAPLDAALADARAEGFDAMLILGDLLSYGVNPAETLDLVADAVARDGAILVRGNHDQLYLESDPTTLGYLRALPDWLRESVDWTAERIDAGVMAAFDWREFWEEGGVFAAHANPHRFGDWTYLADAARAEAASVALIEQGYRHGVFGHAHRARRFDCGGASIHVVGSLGQPRDDGDRQPQWAMIFVEADAVRVEARPVRFDRAAQIAAIGATTMSHATRERLCEYFL